MRPVEVIRIGVCVSDDFSVGAKPLSPEPFLQVWKMESFFEH